MFCFIFHLVVLKDYRKRIIQLGEENWRIKTIGLHELNYKKNINAVDYVDKVIDMYEGDVNKKDPVALLT